MLTKAIQGLERVIYPINAIAQRIAMIVLFLMMMITVIDVTGRMFSKPLYGAFELTGFGLALVIFYSLGYTQMKKGHISVSFLVDKWPVRVQAVADLIMNVIFLTLVAVTTWQVFQYAIRLFNGNEKTADLGIPIYIMTILASIGLLCFALSILLDLLKSLNEAVKKHEH
ncbi:TRAP dicarboxylate transporter [Halalkalibacter wakoensis JCM 9140]|uniref:TRAP dicarboxylate transporter n=1 Tax=Halalkalibacter wakoensis JCM 9140 TaxID=1236970 RepID=W4Q9I8_9BACI|nr:TRAP transporter small permease [Halalkalibacter wakoensis]GAE28049.1 TRAP dicarboxylate transporter [Halalkalibacter wakoensis JCM 9140]